MKILNSRQLAVRVSLLAVILIFDTASAETTSESANNAPVALSNFIKSSLEQQPTLLAAKADIQSAKAALRASSQAIYNPELELGYEDATDKTKTIGITQTIDRGDQRGSREIVAKANLNTVAVNYQVEIQAFIGNLLAGLAENQSQQELVQLSKKTLKLIQEFKEIAERRYLAGDLTQVDLNLARLAYHQALLDQVNAQSKATDSREKLRSIIGSLPKSLPLLPEQLPEPILNDDLEYILRNLPVVRAQLAKVQLAKQQIALRKSEQAWNPTVGVTAGSEGGENLIGLNLSIPLNVRNNFSAEVDVARQELIASEQRAQIAYRNTRARLAITTERYSDLLSASNHWRENGRISIEQQLILVDKLWQVGEITATDYLMQIKQVLDIQVAGLELRSQLWLVAFDWMNLTATADDWLNINIDLLEKNTL